MEGNHLVRLFGVDGFDIFEILESLSMTEMNPPKNDQFELS